MDLTSAEYLRRDGERLREVLGGPPVTWVFVGDSITQAVMHTHGRRGFVEHFAERVRGELGRRGDAVVNTGVAGSTADEALAEFHWRAGRFAPDVVVLMFATNDAAEGADGIRAFRYTLDQLVQRSRDLGATVVLMTPPPARSTGTEHGRSIDAYAEQVRMLARDLGVVLVDHHERWASVTAVGGADGWFDDDVHPSAEGHLEIAKRLFQVLEIAEADRPSLADPTRPSPVTAGGGETT